jgi:hypothetical protein
MVGQERLNFLRTWNSISCAAGHSFRKEKPPEPAGEWMYIHVYDVVYDVVCDVVYDMHFDLNRAFLQAVGRRGRGRQDIDLHLLKPARFRPEPGWALPPAVSDRVIHDDVLDPAPEWISYEYRTTHPVLRWLPTKLAEWIGANLSEELLIPDKIEDKWTAAELNSILLNNVVQGPYGHLHTFGGIQWECDLFNGRPKARCYPFNIVGHRFWDKTPQVVLQHRIQCCIRCRLRCRI